jgi:hypothetical protein
VFGRILCKLLQQCSLNSQWVLTTEEIEFMITVKEKYFKLMYLPVGILLIFYGVMYFKFKLRLKFREDRNYRTMIVNWHTGLQ